MISKTLISILIGALLGVGSNAIPTSTCNADNCLRALRASTRNVNTASSFCNSYVNTALGTVTVTATSVTTITPAQSTTTITTGTTTLTSNTVCYSSATTTATVYFKKREDASLPPNGPVALGKRDDAILPPNVPAAFAKREHAFVQPNILLDKRADTDFGSYITSACPKLGTTAIPARITSACSCFLTSATTTSTSLSTVTAPAPTQTTVFKSFASTETTYSCTSTSTITSTVVQSKSAACTDLPNPYTAPNNDMFNLHCGSFYYANKGENRILDTTVGSVVECYNLCSTTDTCVAVDWFQPGTVTDGGFNCYLLKDTSLGSTPFSQADAAALVQ